MFLFLFARVCDIHVPLGCKGTKKNLYAQAYAKKNRPRRTIFFYVALISYSATCASYSFMHATNASALSNGNAL